MEPYLIHLLYLALILMLGILVTAISNQFRLSNILFLVLAGYVLKLIGLDLFAPGIILILMALALIVIVLETTMDLDLGHITKNFLHVLRFSVAYFLISAYVLTLVVYLLFDLPGGGFELFSLSLLLSIIIYGSDPSISLEFARKRVSKVHDILRIEGIISGPLVVIVAFFLIDFLSAPASLDASVLGQGVAILEEFAVILGVSFILAFLLHKLLQHFKLSSELYGLSTITMAIAVFAITELLEANGSLAVAFFGFFLWSLTRRKTARKYGSIYAHLLYLIVFILLGMQFVMPSLGLWMKGLALYAIYLAIRFLSVLLLYRDLNIKEQTFVALNTAKGIEVAFVLLLMNLNFQDIPGIATITSLAFMVFILSYILSTIVDRYCDFFLEEEAIPKEAGEGKQASSMGKTTSIAKRKKRKKTKKR